MLQALLPILSLVIKAILELFIEKGLGPDEAIIADRNPERRDALRRRVSEVKGRLDSSRRAGDAG